MHTDTLKELLKIYSKLPTGLIVFKNRRIYFINDHLRDVLSLGTIPPDEALAMIGGILEQPATDKSIYTFFEEHDFFTYKNKYIQIISRSEKPYHIFVFALLEPELLDKLSQMDASRRRIEPIADDDITHEYLIDADEHKNLLQHFDSRRNSKARGYVLYRGVPLIADVIAVQPLKGTLAVRAGDKQMVSATTGTPWILSFASGKTILGEAVHANPEKRLVFLQPLRETTEGFHQRQHIRYTLDEPLDIIIELEQPQQLKVLELSEKALRAVTDDARTLDALSRPERLFKAVLNLDEERLQVSCRFLKEAGRCEGEAAVILEFSCDENEMGALRNFLNARQIAVIKTVNEFTRSLT